MGKAHTKASAKKSKAILGVAVAAAVCLLCACSPAVSESSPEAAEGSEVAGFTWTEDANCETCHKAEGDSLLDESCLAGIIGHNALTCMTCHDDAEGLSTAHKKVEASDTDGAEKLKKTEVSEDTCLSCHTGDYTPEATADVTALTDTNGLTVNPHDLPQSTNHERIDCSSCHPMHSGTTATEQAPKVCSDCHHTNVYECGTCH